MGGFLVFFDFSPIIFILYFYPQIKQLTRLRADFYLFQLAFDYDHYAQMSVAGDLNQIDASRYGDNHSGLQFAQPLDD